MNQLKQIGVLCMLLVFSLAAKAGDVSAVWDFKNDLPAGINNATNIQGTTGGKRIRADC